MRGYRVCKKVECASEPAACTYHLSSYAIVARASCRMSGSERLNFFCRARLLMALCVDLLLMLEKEPGMMTSKRMLRDLVVEASGVQDKKAFDTFLADLFGERLSQQLRSQLHNAFRRLISGHFTKSSSRKAKPVVPGSWRRDLKAERAY